MRATAVRMMLRSAALVATGAAVAIPVWAAIAVGTSGAALAAASSSCEPLPAAATPSPTTPAVLLCVSVQSSQSGVTRGQAASFTVLVWAENGPVSGVSVALTGTPQGEEPAFTGRCPSGDGSASCTIGSLATAVSPSSYQMQAQIPVASGATSVTSVTLTATADAGTSPAMTVLPTAAETVTVSAPTAAASTPPASGSPVSTPSPVASPVAVPAVATTPATGPTASSAVSTPPISPVGVVGGSPVISTPATAAVAIPPSSVADTGTPPAGRFIVSMPVAAAELLGFTVLALLLVAALLTGRWLAARGTSGAKPLQAGGDAEAREGFVTKHLRFLRFWPGRPPGQPNRWRPAARPGSYDAGTRTSREDAAEVPRTGSVAAHSGTGPATEDQS